MTEFDTFIEVLEISVKRNGRDKALTIGHILNLAKMASKIHQKREEDDWQTTESNMDNFWNDKMRYGSGD